jgi:L-ectoine synthase
MISPDIMYVLNNHDPHIFRATSEEVVLISVFNPPITGNEVHDEDGSYNINKGAK